MSDRPTRDGECRIGFSRFVRRETERSDGTAVVHIQRYKQKHRFNRGYSDVGRPRELTMGLSRREARAVRDLLDAWLDGEGDDE